MKSNNFSYVPYVNSIIKVKNKTLDQLLSLMKYNRRREINLSLKENVIYREAENTKEIAELYNILKDLYLNRVKLPMPNLSYFEKVFQSSIGKVFVVLHNNKIIGGSFCFYDKNAIYTSYYCGLKNYHKKIFPTHIAIIAAMEFAIKNAIEFVDLMGAGKKNEEYGVRKYKMEFGGELVEYGRFINILNPFWYKIGVWGLKFLKRT